MCVLSLLQKCCDAINNIFLFHDMKLSCPPYNVKPKFDARLCSPACTLVKA